MHDVSIKRPQRLDVGKLVSELTKPSSSGWQAGRYRIQLLAQDQVLLELVQGSKCDTFKGLWIDSRDAQSDAGRKVLKGPATTDFDVFYQMCLTQSALEPPVGWPILEGYLETDPPCDAESESCEAEPDEQAEIVDELADEWTPDRLADELPGLDIENEWPRLRELILTAEDFDFTPEKSALLSPRLLALAVQYRDSNDQQDAPVVLSAIRTGASMLRPNEANRLLTLLQPGHSIDTVLVSLKMLGRIFEAQPPDRPDQHTELASEVRGIAKSLLSAYAITSSRSAAMAQLAVCTLAAMGSSETLRIVQDVHRMGVSWFSRQTARELRELRSSWGARSTPVAPEVLELLDRATQELQTT